MIRISVIDDPLYQWDKGRRVKIIALKGETIDNVHYSNGMVAEVTVEDGYVTAPIPNILLQTPQNITVYAVVVSADGIRTACDSTFPVRAKPKPDDYVYTETEIKTWDSLKEEIEAEIDEQIEAGIEEIKNQSIVSDMYSNALRGAAAGSAVTLDVSPIEHTLGIKAKSKNLFDITKATVNTKLSVGSGEIETNSQFTTSDYIAIQPNTAFVGNLIQYCAFYDKDKKYISDIGEKSSTVERALTMPQNAYYIRFTFKKSVTDGSNTQIEEGTVATLYTPYVADLSTANVIKYGGNLLDIENREVVNFGAGANTTIRKFTGNGIIKGIAYNNYYQPSNVISFEKHKNGFSFTNKENQAPYGIGFDFKAMPNMTFVAHYEGMEKISGNLVYLSEYDKDGNYLRTPTTRATTNTRYFTTGENTAWVVVNFQNTPTQLSGDFNNVYVGIDTFNGFEEYQEPVTYPITADGTVEGVTSIYPTTTLIPDTPGVVIDVKYNRDINKAFEELQNAIISIGGILNV